jgi:dTDP-4-dehydrorhamnose 3,5-epimerase-like enzyme
MLKGRSQVIANIKTIDFPVLGDDRGKLIALEALSEQIPFDVKRVYYIFDTTLGTVRGKHAHKKLKQILICVSGACTISCELLDGTKTEYRLDWPTKGLLIEGMVWHEMKDFSKDAVLLVLASEHYNEADYVRNYSDFKKKGGV